MTRSRCILAIVALLLAPGVPRFAVGPTLAQGIQGPPGERAYCALYDDGSPSDCEFPTLQACQATVSGTGGFCEPNVRLPGPPQANQPPGLPRLFGDPIYAPPVQAPVPPPPNG